MVRINPVLASNQTVKKFSTNSDDNEIFFGSQEIAGLLDITPQRVQQLTKEGLPRKSRGEYPVKSCVKWYVNYLRNKADTDTITANKLRLVKAKAEKAELENQKIKSDLVSKEEIRKEAMMIAAIVKESLQSIPGRLSPLLENKRTGEIKKELQFEVIQTLNLLAERLISLGTS